MIRSGSVHGGAKRARRALPRAPRRRSSCDRRRRSCARDAPRDHEYRRLLCACKSDSRKASPSGKKRAVSAATRGAISAHSTHNEPRDPLGVGRQPNRSPRSEPSDIPHTTTFAPLVSPSSNSERSTPNVNRPKLSPSTCAGRGHAREPRSARRELEARRDVGHQLNLERCPREAVHAKTPTRPGFALSTTMAEGSPSPSRSPSLGSRRVGNTL